MSLYSAYTDEQLLPLLQSNDEGAFTEIYGRYSGPLYYNILAMVKDENTSEELVQDIFSRIWQKRQFIRISTGFKAYLFTVSRNAVYDFFRQLRRNRKLYAQVAAVATEHYVHVEEALMAKENADLLQKAIASLPAQRRTAFELCKIEGLSYREASQRMGVSLSTVKDHMAHAQRAIRLFVSSHPELGVVVAVALLWEG